MSSGPDRFETWDTLEASGRLDGLTWRYIAPPDACPVGRELHGRELASLAEVYELLPDLNENPRCTRRPCTCTALPGRATS